MVIISGNFCLKTLCSLSCWGMRRYRTINVQINIDFVILYKEKGNFAGASMARLQGLNDFLHRATDGRPCKQYIIKIDFRDCFAGQQHLLFSLKMFHRNIFKGYIFHHWNKGKRSCPLPLEKAVAFSHPIPRAPKGWRRVFRRLRTATRGFAPWPHKPFEKGLTENFYNCFPPLPCGRGLMPFHFW